MKIRQASSARPQPQPRPGTVSPAAANKFPDIVSMAITGRRVFMPPPVMEMESRKLAAVKDIIRAHEIRFELDEFKNPLHLWAIYLESRWHKLPIPEKVLDYFDKVAQELLKLTYCPSISPADVKRLRNELRSGEHFFGGGISEKKLVDAVHSAQAIIRAARTDKELQKTFKDLKFRGDKLAKLDVDKFLSEFMRALNGCDPNQRFYLAHILMGDVGLVISNFVSKPSLEELFQLKVPGKKSGAGNAFSRFSDVSDIEIAIAVSVELREEGKIDNAVKSVAKENKVSTRTVYRAWSRWKHRLSR